MRFICCDKGFFACMCNAAACIPNTPCPLKNTASHPPASPLPPSHTRTHVCRSLAASVDSPPDFTPLKARAGSYDATNSKPPCPMPPPTLMPAGLCGCQDRLLRAPLTSFRTNCSTALPAVRDGSASTAKCWPTTPGSTS
jgi:hypothetical protein